MCATGVSLSMTVCGGVRFDVGGYLRRIGCSCEGMNLLCSTSIVEGIPAVAFCCEGCRIGVRIREDSSTDTAASQEGTP